MSCNCMTRTSQQECRGILEKSRAVSRAEEAALFACCEMCIKIMLQISETDEMIKGILTNHNTGIMITP